MEKRSYKKYTEVYVKLEEHCQKMRKLGMVLPGERELALTLNSSRMTLRKALEMAEMNGLIRRKNKFTEIISQEENFRNCGKILFISAGYCNEFTLGAFQRLWNRLQIKLDKMGVDYQLLLTNLFTSKEEVQNECENADIILLTSIQFDNIFKPDVSFLVEMKSRKTIIALSDPYLDHFDNYIALDNYAAGMLAASALKTVGCCKPAFVTYSSNNFMFQKRFHGFYDFMKHIGIDITTNFTEDNPKHFSEICRAQLLDALHHGCDSAFLASDESIGFITLDLFRKKLVPKEFKIITVNGKGEALLCNPPITCVNHATEEVVQILVDYLREISRNPNPAPIKKLVKPSLYLNKTIGEININAIRGWNNGY